MKVVQLNPSVILHGSLIEPGKFESHTDLRFAQVFNVGTQTANRVYRVEFIQDDFVPAAEIEWPWALIQLSLDDVFLFHDTGKLPDHTEDRMCKVAEDAIAFHRQAMQTKKEKDEKEAVKEAKKAKKV